MLPKKPKVSIIIPTYNAARFIESAIKSVIHQTFTNNEIIVVDDGSTDNTKGILKKHVENKSIIYIRQENSGPAAARNNGIKAATGELVCFLDADDLLRPNSIEHRLRVFKRHHEVGVVFTDFRKIFWKSTKEKDFVDDDIRQSNFLKTISTECIKRKDNNIYVFNTNIFYELIVSNFIFTGTVMMRRDIFDEVGFFDESLMIAEDHDLWLRASRKYNMAFLHIDTATYRFHADNITKDIPLVYASSINVRDRYLDPKYGLPKRYRRKLSKTISQFYFSKGYHYFENKLYEKARTEFKSAIRYNPTKGKYYLYLSFTEIPPGILDKLRLYKRTFQKQIS
jgi:glycosyltransferase involved in cell wall biosynthesis